MSRPWLLIEDIASYSPFVSSLVDHTTHLAIGDGPSGPGGSERLNFSMLMKQRGTANIPLALKASDSYQPNVGAQIYLYDVSADLAHPGQTVQTCVFAGSIDKIETSWWGNNGNRLVALTCVSFESVFDTLRVPGRVYQNQTAGFIFRDLFLLAAGSPLSAGTIDNGPIISTFLIEDYPTIAAVFDRLTTENENQYIWYVDSTTLTINFAPPGVIAAPFTPQTTDILYENFSVRFDRQDFRNRQTIKLEYDAFGRSDEVFTGSGQQAFTLRNPVHDVTNAWITKNTANTATGTFTGIPKAGDTVTVSYPSTGSVYNWAASSPYFVGYQILDPNNHIQQVASVNAGLAYPGVPNSGKSGTTEPSWNDAGGTTNDYGVTWQDKGSLGGALYVVQTYNFVSTLDNAQAGEVLIGGTAADSAQNLCDAINASVQYEFSTSPVVYKGPGLNYSLPTWENRLLNCDQPSGATITVRNKYVGKGFVAALSSLSEVFSWSASQTSGGVTTFGTNSISVGLTTAQSGGSGSNLPSLSYTPGLNTVYLSSPLNVGTYLAVEYHRLDGDLISVENTALVTYRANIEQSTGKYQALTSDSSATPIQGLVEAQQALLAFEAMPEFLEFLTFRPGLQPGMLLTLGFNEPQGPQLKAPQSLTGSTITGTITIDSTQCGSVNSTQWTFLFSQTDPNLRTVANGGYAQNSNGYDITFTSDIYGLNPLTWEVEYYNPVTGQMIAWVLLPLLSVSNNTQLYVQVGNSSITSFQGGGVGAAWNNYNAVYHFAGAGPSMSDSTGGGNTATNYGATPTTFAQGQIDGAVSFDGVSNSVVAPGLYNKNIGSLELWINVPSGAPTGSFYITGNASSLGYGPTIYANGIGIKSIGVRFGTYDNNVELFPSGVWCLIAMTWDGTTVRTYKNGQQVDARGWSDPGTLANQINLGDRNIAGTDSDYWQGFLDEFRVSGVARSPSWVLANYNNQWSPSTFYSLVWGVAWIVQEVEGELIPVQRDEMLGPLGGHFRYHVHCINAAQIGSYLDFWKSLGGSATGGASGGGSATPAFGGTPFPASPAAGTPIGGVNVKTANYTISSQDNGVMVVANGPGSPVTSLTFLLPATPPSAVWWCAISNIGPGALTVSPNGLMLDGAGTGLSVPQYQGVLIYSDGSNYYTDRGLSSSSGFADDETPSGAINGSNMTYTLTYTPNPASSLELFVNGVLQLPGVDFTLSGNIITYTNPLSVSGLPAISDWHRAWYRH